MAAVSLSVNRETAMLSRQKRLFSKLSERDRGMTKLKALCVVEVEMSPVEVSPVCSVCEVSPGVCS